MLWVLTLGKQWIYRPTWKVHMDFLQLDFVLQKHPAKFQYLVVGFVILVLDILQKNGLMINPTDTNIFFLLRKCIHGNIRKSKWTFQVGKWIHINPLCGTLSHHLYECNPINQVAPSISKQWLCVSSNSQKILLKCLLPWESRPQENLAQAILFMLCLSVKTQLRWT